MYYDTYTYDRKHGDTQESNDNIASIGDREVKEDC